MSASSYNAAIFISENMIIVATYANVLQARNFKLTGLLMKTFMIPKAI